MRHLSALLLLLLLSAESYGQTNADEYILTIRRTDDPIVIDGKLDERTWQNAQVAGDFFRITPMDTGYAETRTDVMVAYNDEYFYLAAICYDPLPGNNIIASLRRDFNFSLNDNFIFFLDTFQDKTNGFSFGASAAGAQWDGLQSDGGTVALEWDNKWYSRVVNLGDRQIHEYAIPFRSIRYREDVDKWGINFSRMDNKRNEKSSWAPVPRQFPSAALAFAGTLKWDEPPPPAGTNISLIPYVSGRALKNHATGEQTDYTFNSGFDAKFAVTTSLNLDLTVNPDFSQVEVDRQVTNLSRFELFFPERRQFFLENSDLFANFGDPEIRPFFSRRIGLESPIISGARLSGKINRDWRIGVMDMVTNRVDSMAFPAQNYFVAAVQRQVLERSNLSFIFVNRDGLDIQTPDTTTVNWNRVAGAEFNLFTENNLWTGKAFLHGSFSPDAAGIAEGVQFGYQGQNLNFGLKQVYVDNDFDAVVGFVPRKGYARLNPYAGYQWYPESQVVNRHGPALVNNVFFTDGWGFTDLDVTLEYSLLMLNTAQYTLGVRHSYIQLTQPFDPTNSGKVPLLPAGNEYTFTEVQLAIRSDRRRLLNYLVEASYGGYFSATRLNIKPELNYRFQPYGSISLTADFNQLKFESEDKNINFLLLGPKFDITFTRNIFLTAWVQYNNQINNINLNTRFQWRFAPVSDLFIVYTDNYYSENIKVKNRALVVKLNYWFNL